MIRAAAAAAALFFLKIDIEDLGDIGSKTEIIGVKTVFLKFSVDMPRGMCYKVKVPLKRRSAVHSI